MATGIDFSTRRGGLSRRIGGVVAFAYPLALTALSLSVGFDEVGDMTDIAAAVLATMLFLVAAPTAWLFTVEFIEAGRLLVIVSALATSLPLWYLVGSRLAYYADAWTVFARRYVVLCLVWNAINVVVVVVLGSIGA